MDGDLRNASNTIFNRIFQSDDFAVGRVEGVKHRIESGGFTGASRADHEDEAARMRDDFIDLFELVGRKTEKIKVKQRFVKIKETEHGILAVHGRDGFDANIEKM